MRVRFLWEMDDLRRRLHDSTRGEPGCPGVSGGERRERAVRPLSGAASEPARGAWHPDWVPDEVGSPPRLQRGFEHQREDVRGAGRLTPIARRLDDLAHELDQRQNEARESGRAAIKALVVSMAPRRDQRQNQEPGRVPRECVEIGALERDRRFAVAPDGWITSRVHACDELESSSDNFTNSAFNPNLPARRIRRVNTSPPWATIAPFASADLEAVSPIANPQLPPGACCTDRASDDAGESHEPRRGLKHQETEFEAIEHLSSITRRLDELACELDERESDATDAEIAAFKHRLTALAREIDQQHISETGLDEADEYVNPRTGQLEPRARHTEDRGDFAGVRRSSLPMVPRGQRQDEALAAGLSAINALVNSMAPPRFPHPSRMPVHAPRECVDTGALERDQQFPTVPERWTGSPTRERDQAGSPEDPLMISASDRVLPPISSARSEGAAYKRLPWSTMAPFAKAVLAAVLAITVVVTGTYFVRARVPGASAATLLAAIFKEKAPAPEISAPRSLGVAPQNTLARFQEQVFQLPNLYGIYAINSDKLFELEALPGQVPDRRVPVSAVIPQPSRTTLSDGRIAFLVFRRDVATNISERVPIRVVAKIRRETTSTPAGEPGSAVAGDAWTIRNIAFAFRVAPVEQNREMVLLRPEDSGFTFPAGRYALILKGQAYDFTVAGTITDPAQCLERVEAANGSFFHECQQPEAGTAGPPLQKSTPPQRSRLSSTIGRKGELHARAYD